MVWLDNDGKHSKCAVCKKYDHIDNFYYCDMCDVYYCDKHTIKSYVSGCLTCYYELCGLPC